VPVDAQLVAQLRAEGGQLDGLVEQAGRDAGSGGYQQNAVQRHAGAQPFPGDVTAAVEDDDVWVFRFAAARHELGATGGAGQRRAAVDVEVALQERRWPGQATPPHGGAGDPVAGRVVEPAPPPQLRLAGGVLFLQPVGEPDKVGDAEPLPGTHDETQPAAFGGGGVGERGEQRLRQAARLEPAPLGVPAGQGGQQRRVAGRGRAELDRRRGLTRRVAGPGFDPCQQIRTGRVGQQPQANRTDLGAQQQRRRVQHRPAADVQLTSIRVGDGKPARRVGIQLQPPAGEHEAPGLGVMDRRRARRAFDDTPGHLRRQSPPRRCCRPAAVGQAPARHGPRLLPIRPCGRTSARRRHRPGHDPTAAPGPACAPVPAPGRR